MGGKDRHDLQVGEISRGLKLLSNELDVPVVALSQLNRGLESRDNKRPKLSDLRDSGALEQDADVIMFVYRDCIYNQNANPNLAELIIAKNREDATGTIPVRFVPETTEFQNLAKEEVY